MLVCYQQEIFFVHFRFFLTYKCETLNIRNICPQGARKEKQKLKVKNTKNKFLIIFKFSSREKKKKYLQVEKRTHSLLKSVKWVMSDSFKSIFLEIYGQDAGCRLVYIFVNLRLFG